MKIEIRKSDLGGWWFVLLGRNSKVVMTSEMYVSRSNARRAARKTGRALRLDVLEQK